MGAPGVTSRSPHSYSCLLSSSKLSGDAARSARWAIHGARVYTLDPALPAAEAVAIEGERIAAVGSSVQVRAALPGVSELDLGGGAALFPGLTDCHGHLLDLGDALSGLDLSKARDPQDLAAAVSKAAQSPGWIVGRGWDESGFPERALPDRALLDAAAPGRLVYLERTDGHAALVSSSALGAAGLAESSDPPGGRIQRRADGAPTGVLIDSAAERVRALITRPRPEVLEARLAAAARRCVELGLTCVHDAGTDTASYAALERLARRGELPLRVRAMARAAGADASEVRRCGPRGEGLLTLACAKLFLDGALGSRGAALLQDYADDPGNRGLLQAGDELAGSLAEWMRAGFQVALHAIGDRANALALDALERCRRALPPGDRRPRIEHAQVLRAEDLPRFARLGAVASMQPGHAVGDARWAKDRLGPERLRFAYAWRALLDAGAAVAFGSDFPIESPDPLLGICAACAPQGEGSASPAPLEPAEALAAYTAGAAWASFEESEAGRVAAGFRADLSAFSSDPMAAAPGERSKARAVLTVVEGRVVFSG